MEIQHTSYCQIKSVIGSASIPNTEFGSLLPNKFNICSHWFESVRNIAELGQYFELHKSKILV